MSVLKFECPACNQHMECDRACAGDIIHCPRCCAELRIPFSEMPGSVLRAELILHAPKPSAPAQAAQKQVASPPPNPQPTEVLCPICESHLRIRPGASNPGNPPALAELIKKGEPKPVEPAQSRKVDEAHPDLAHMSLEEREQQIAAAREAHPITLNTHMKPRLDHIFSEKAAPVGNSEPKPEKPSDAQNPDSPNTFTE